jgi:hypothetical protein
VSFIFYYYHKRHGFVHKVMDNTYFVLIIIDTKSQILIPKRVLWGMLALLVLLNQLLYSLLYVLCISVCLYHLFRVNTNPLIHGLPLFYFYFEMHFHLFNIFVFNYSIYKLVYHKCHGFVYACFLVYLKVWYLVEIIICQT